MTGKAYYLTTLADWQRHAARFANSHFVVLAARASSDVECGSLLPPFGAGASSGTTEATASEETPARPASVANTSDTSGASNINDVETKSSTLSSPQPTLALLANPRSTPEQAQAADSGGKPPHSTNTATRILVLIEADEGVHLSLDDDSAFEPLPHPLAQKAISDAAQSALAPHGVAPGATTFDAAEALARVHPLLRHRVF
jgi:hypothetical protein